MTNLSDKNRILSKPAKVSKLKVLHKIADLINSTTNLKTLLRRILRETVVGMGSDGGLIATIDTKSEQLEIAAVQGIDEQVIKDLSTETYYQTLISCHANGEKIALTERTSAVPGTFFLLIVEEQIFGVLWLKDINLKTISQEALDLGTSIANQTARVVKTVGIFEKQADVTEKLKAIFDLGSEINVFAPLPIIISSITAALPRFVNIKQCTLLLTKIGDKKSFFQPGISVLDIRKPEGLRPGKKPKRSKPSTLFSVPIEHESQILGMLNIYTELPHILTEEENIIISAFASMSGLLLSTALKMEEQSRLSNQLRLADRKNVLAAVGNYLAENMNDSVSVISVLLDIMKENGAFETDHSEDLNRLYQRLNYTNNLSQRLIKIVKPPAPILEYINVNDSIEFIIGLFERTASLKQIMINPRLAGDLPEILISKSDLHLMISVLFDNAIQAMPSGGLLNVTTSLIYGSDSITPSVLRINVRDTGRGFTIDTPQDLINPFNMQNELPTYGISLFSVQNIAFTYGARLTLRNGSDHGASVSINFPLSGNLA